MHIVISCIEARDEFCLSYVRSKAIEGEERGTVATQREGIDIKGKEDEGEISVNSLLSPYNMPLSELAKVSSLRSTVLYRIHPFPQKSCGLNFDIAAEEMRRLKTSPSEEEWAILYGLYMQVLHGDTPNEDIYRKTTTVLQCYRMPIVAPPTEGKDAGRYAAWKGRKGTVVSI